VDFQEFVGGLSAFSSRGGREEKLRCMSASPSFTDTHAISVAFAVYDVDRDGYISNGELFLVLKMMVGNNLKVNSVLYPHTCLLILWQDQQLQQIVDKTIMEADQDGDGKLSFEEFSQTVVNTVRFLYIFIPGFYIAFAGHRQTDDSGGFVLDVLPYDKIRTRHVTILPLAS